MPCAASQRLRAALAGTDDPENAPRTQTALALRLRVTSQAVNAWLSGRTTPSLALAVEIERIYGIPVADWLPARE